MCSGFFRMVASWLSGSCVHSAVLKAHYGNDQQTQVGIFSRCSCDVVVGEMTHCSAASLVSEVSVWHIWVEKKCFCFVLFSSQAFYNNMKTTFMLTPMMLSIMAVHRPRPTSIKHLGPSSQKSFPHFNFKVTVGIQNNWNGIYWPHPISYCNKICSCFWYIHEKTSALAETSAWWSFKGGDVILWSRHLL